MRRRGNAPKREESRKIHDLMIALGYVLDIQENPCPYHAWRVAALSTAIAREIVPDSATDVFLAALLHDVGAMGSFTHMVLYPNLMDQKSKPEVIAHPQRGYQLLLNMPGLRNAAELVADHHEWWNGGGYPFRKQQDMIPEGAQIIRLADSMDLTKMLRPGCTGEQAAEAAQFMANVEVSSDIVDAFRSVVSDAEFFSRLIDSDELYPLLKELEAELPAAAFPRRADVLGSMLVLFARVVDAKHCYTAGHSERVASFSIDIAEAMELPRDEVAMVRFAGLVHDAGKVAIRRSIIDKTGPLSPSEFAQVREHPALSMRILTDLGRMPELASIVLHHHERWDGMGYPEGLQGERIPLLSRILAVADALDAITSPRSYKPARTIKDALTILDGASGAQFDPDIIDAAHKAWNTFRGE